jgi:hypothetical protein
MTTNNEIQSKDQQGETNVKSLTDREIKMLLISLVENKVELKEYPSREEYERYKNVFISVVDGLGANDKRQEKWLDWGVHCGFTGRPKNQTKE